jgi:hypothetical protein
MTQTTPKLIRRVLSDEALTRGLGDIEARMIVDWLVGWAEYLMDLHPNMQVAEEQLDKWCMKARAIGRFIRLWEEDSTRPAAMQLAGVERFPWPLPDGSLPVADVLEQILAWESRYSTSLTLS